MLITYIVVYMKNSGNSGNKKLYICIIVIIYMYYCLKAKLFTPKKFRFFVTTFCYHYYFYPQKVVTVVTKYENLP